MKPSNKLYKVKTLSIEEGVEISNVDSQNVIATDAIGAANKVRLVKTKRRQTFIESVEFLHKIDKM